MYQSKTGELEEYVRRVGENIKIIHSRLIELSKRIEEMEEKIAEVKAEQANNANAISDLKTNTVQKIEFDEFVNRLTESLRELLPPLGTGTEETQKEEQT